MIDATKEEMAMIRAMSDADLLAQLNGCDPYDDEFRRRFIALAEERDALEAEAEGAAAIIAAERAEVMKLRTERDALEAKNQQLRDAFQQAIEAAEQRGYARGVEAVVEKMRRLSGKLDILACEDVLKIADDLSALSPTPPAPVTVQEAARALLDQTPKALDAGIEALKAAADDGHGADVCLAHVLRALAEQEAPSTPPRDGVD